jgi:hypothetical protein
MAADRFWKIRTKRRRVTRSTWRGVLAEWPWGYNESEREKPDQPKQDDENDQK